MYNIYDDYIEEVGMKTLILVGNGFNYFVKGYIENKQNEDEIFKKWVACSKAIHKDKWTLKQKQQWLGNLKEKISSYCDLLSFLELENYETKGETLLSVLEAFFMKINYDQSQSESMFNSIEEAVANIICDKFKETIDVEEKIFAKHPNAAVKFAFYSSVMNQYFGQRLRDIINKYVGKEDYIVFTTNYDYIVESVFGEEHSVKKVKGVRCAHLHGHYAKDKYASIVCCAPEKKINKIEENDKNRVEFEVFQDEIENTDVILLVGIGLVSDPHILNKLNQIRGKHIIIVDRNREQYFNNHLLDSSIEEDLKFNFLNNNDIYFIDTELPTFDGYKLKNVIRTPDALLEAIRCTTKRIKQEATCE